MTRAGPGDVERGPTTTSRDGVHERDGAPPLFWRWRPAPTARATVVILHGIGEHSGRYEHVFDVLNQGGYACLAVDLRGFGRSGGPRAFVHRFEDFLDDVEAGLGLAETLGGSRARLLLGHSMGGLIAARFAQERGGELHGVALSSPGLAIPDEVPLWKHGLGVILSRLIPRFSLSTEIDVAALSHDLEMVEPFRTDPLAVWSITARLYTELLAAQRDAIEGAARIGCPLLVQAAEADPVVDVAGTHRFVERARGVEVQAHWYPRMYHEIFNEIGREQVFAHLLAWLDSRTG